MGRIDLGGSPDIVACKKLKIKSDGKEMNLKSDQISRHPDSNGVNDTPI